MTRLSAQFGDGGAGDGFAGVLLRALRLDPDTNQTSLATRIGWPEQTFRGFLNGKSSPRFDSLCAARKRMPRQMLLDAAQTLVGANAVVISSDLYAEAVERATPAAVLGKAIESLHELTEFLEETKRRGDDGRIDAADAATIATQANDVHRVLIEAVLIAQRCAGVSGGAGAGVARRGVLHA